MFIWFNVLTASTHEYSLLTCVLVLLQRLLSAFLSKLFSRANFAADFVLVPGKEAKGSDIVMPEGSRLVGDCR